MGCLIGPNALSSGSPTNSSQIPPNYKEKFSQQRAEKVENFGDIISVFGMSNVAATQK